MGRLLNYTRETNKVPCWFALRLRKSSVALTGHLQYVFKKLQEHSSTALCLRHCAVTWHALSVTFRINKNNPPVTWCPVLSLVVTSGRMAKSESSVESACSHASCITTCYEDKTCILHARFQASTNLFRCQVR